MKTALSPLAYSVSVFGALLGQEYVWVISFGGGKVSGFCAEQ